MCDLSARSDPTRLELDRVGSGAMVTASFNLRFNCATYTYRLYQTRRIIGIFFFLIPDLSPTLYLNLAYGLGIGLYSMRHPRSNIYVICVGQEVCVCVCVCSVASDLRPTAESESHHPTHSNDHRPIASRLY